MPRELLHWHYLHAVRREVSRLEERDQDQRFLMAMLRPDAYKKLIEQEKAPVYETELKTDDIQTAEDLRNLVSVAEARMRNARVAQYGEPDYNPITLTED